MATPPPTRISPDLAHALEANPDLLFSLLIRVTQVDDSTEQSLLACGVEIRRRVTLIPTFAVMCKGGVALALLDFSWVQHIEADYPVHTMLPGSLF